MRVRQHVNPLKSGMVEPRKQRLWIISIEPGHWRVFCGTTWSILKG